MPVFHEYSENYHKSGYYVQVKWSAPHPHPLQTPSITTQIYLELGYEPGDDVPNELTSRLYHAGLHYTEDQEPGQPTTHDNPDSVVDSNLPTLSPDQLGILEQLLDRSINSDQFEDIDPDSLQTLRSQLRQLTESRTNTDSVKIVSALEGIWDRPVSTDEATTNREKASNPREFDTGLKEFTQKHLITPRDFEINSHGSPTFYFESGAVRWSLADCRQKDLAFDWAVSIATNTERQFGVRINRSGIVCTAEVDGKLTQQQAADLITILPCIASTINDLPTYALAVDWDSTEIQSEFPKPQRNWLVDQTAAIRSTLKGSDIPTEGTIIDLPPDDYGRIRTPNRHIVYTPVEALPEEAVIGTEVTFDVTSRNQQHCATEVELKESTPTERTVTISVEGVDDSIDVPIPNPVPDELTENQVKNILQVWNLSSPAESIDSELFREFALTFPRHDNDLLGQALELLLADSPFEPETFPVIAENIQSHSRLSEYEFSIDVLALAYCVGAFYDGLDTQQAVQEANSQGDTTILYRDGGRILLVGNELLGYPIATGLSSVPHSVFKIGVDHVNTGRDEFDLRIWSALSEIQFHRGTEKGNSLISRVLQSGLKNTGLNVIHLEENAGHQSN